jgi:hypothetical protein
MAALEFLTARSRAAILQYISLEVEWTDRETPIPELPSLFPRQLMHLLADTEEHIPDAYRELQCLRLKNVVYNPRRIHLLLEPSLHKAKISTLDIVFPIEDLNVPVGQSCVNHLKEYDWLRGSESIRCMGIFGFRFVRYPRNNKEFPLLGFLASFPNLETLEIHSELYDEGEFSSLLGDILKDTKLKTIYQHRVTGVALDSLQSFAERNGVEILWGERPQLWPLKLEA